MSEDDEIRRLIAKRGQNVAVRGVRAGEDVREEDAHAADGRSNDVGAGGLKPAATLLIVVAFHVRRRRDLLERADDRQAADVARVQDGVDAAQRRHRLRAQEAVRVGNDAYDQTDAFFPHGVSP